MKGKLFAIIIISLLVGACNNRQAANAEDQATHQHEEPQATADTTSKKPLSPRIQEMVNVGNTHVHIDYSSPSVRGRTIWNGLVAYDQVWVTGAHRATSIDFSTEVIINGQNIPKGKYAFFTIPGEKEWTLILNKNFEQHLADEYDQSLDVIRVNVQPQVLDENVEALTYEITPETGNKGQIKVSWEKISVALPFKIKNDATK